jgi:hypothetical protein
VYRGRGNGGTREKKCCTAGEEMVDAVDFLR